MLNSLAVYDNISIYIKQISSYDLLTEEEEKSLAKKWFYEKDLTAAQKLIVANLRFVVKIAYQYKNYKMKMEDLIQEGNIGLMEAVKRFDPNQGVRLINYASWWIKSKIQSYILKMWRLVKIGTTQAQRKLFFKLNQTYEKIMQQHIGNFEAVVEVAKELKLKDSQVNEMMIRMNNKEYSLNNSVNDDSSATFEDIIPVNKNVEEDFIEKESLRLNKKILKEGFNLLNDREKDIIKIRFFSKNKSLTYQEIGDKYGISKQRVQQIEKSALNKIKYLFESKEILIA